MTAILTYSFRPLGRGSPLRILLGKLLLGPLGGQVQSVDGQHAGGAGGGLNPGVEAAGYDGGEDDPQCGRHGGDGGGGDVVTVVGGCDYCPIIT